MNMKTLSQDAHTTYIAIAIHPSLFVCGGGGTGQRYSVAGEERQHSRGPARICRRLRYPAASVSRSPAGGPGDSCPPLTRLWSPRLTLTPQCLSHYLSVFHPLFQTLYIFIYLFSSASSSFFFSYFMHFKNTGTNLPYNLANLFIKS